VRAVERASGSGVARRAALCATPSYVRFTIRFGAAPGLRFSLLRARSVIPKSPPRHGVGWTSAQRRIEPSVLDESDSNPPRRRPPYGIYAYTGREWDPEINLYYYRARYYDPRVGRFISEDPVEVQDQDSNMYGYVRNQPTQLIDPSGESFCVPLLGEGPATLLFMYYARRSFDEIPNDDRTRDRERHCWASCMTKRWFYCNAMPEITIVFAEGFGGIPANGVDDSWRDTAAHTWGIWVAVVTEESCKKECLKCPLVEDMR